MARFSKTGFNHFYLMKEWFEKVILPYHSKAHNHLVMIIDSASFHLDKQLIKMFTDVGIIT